MARDEVKMEVVRAGVETEPATVDTRTFKYIPQPFPQVSWSLASGAGYTIMEPRFGDTRLMYLNTHQFSYQLVIDKHKQLCLQITPKSKQE